jgi:hypothetical protein
VVIKLGLEVIQSSEEMCEDFIGYFPHFAEIMLAP